ncbi:MAG: hypothetical protein Q7S52_03355 [bacterium]|nr:hypothetical protein [bacterium]
MHKIRIGGGRYSFQENSHGVAREYPVGLPRGSTSDLFYLHTRAIRDSVIVMNSEGASVFKEGTEEEISVLEATIFPPGVTFAENVEGVESATETERRGEELLVLLSSENISSELEVNERFGVGTWAKIKEFGQNSLHKLEISGEKTLNWAEEHGVSLPQSKLGNALAAGAFGAAGLAPFASPLWGIGYVFAKRAQKAGMKQKSLGDMLAAHSSQTALTA